MTFPRIGIWRFNFLSFRCPDVFCSAGKLLRINLASRLGILCLSDSVRMRFRHFEAMAPSVLAPLTDPISCSRVSIDLHAINRALSRVPSINDVAVRFSFHEAIEGFISVDPGCELESEDLKTAISLQLPGYNVPEILHVLKGVPLVRDGESVNFEALEHRVADKYTFDMSELELLVRDTFANLLPIDPMRCTRDSDFFLLGGTSLLLGQLSYRIRKQTGVNIPITTLFNSSTIKDIAAMIDSQLSPATDLDKYSSKGYDDHEKNDQEPGPDTAPSRDQTHPFNLIIQALPLLFYPLQASLMCECNNGIGDTCMIFTLTLVP